MRANLFFIVPSSLLIIIGFSTFGCEEKGPSEAEALPTLDIMWVPKELGNRVFETGRDGAYAKAEELRGLGVYDIDITYMGPESATDVEGQAALVRDAIRLGFDAVAVSCNRPTELKEAINEVVAAGIPVMTFDSDSPESDRFTYLGIDNEQGGTLAARILGESMIDPPKTDVALLSGVQGAANLDARVMGFQNELARSYPNFTIVDIAYCDDNPELGAALTEGLLADNPNLGGIFFVGLWPLGVCSGTDCSAAMPLWDAASRAGSVKTVVFDTLEFQLDFVENGMVAGLVGQKYWGWGYDTVQLIYDRIVNKKAFAPWTDSGIDLVCPNNYAEMISMWQAVDFTDTLSPCLINGKTIE